MSGSGGRQYAQIMKRIWTDEHWKQLSPNAQWLYTLLISQDSINYAGVLPLTVRRWTRLANGVTTEVVHGALEELRTATPSRFVIVDWDTEEVLVRTFIRNDELWKQPRMLAMACSQALTTQSGVLRGELGEELVKLSTLVKSVTSVQETASLLVAGREPPHEPPPGAPHAPPHREGMTPSNGKDYSVDLAPSTVKEGTSSSPVSDLASPARERGSKGERPRGSRAVAEHLNGTAHSPAANQIAEAYATSCTQRPPGELLSTIAVKADGCLQSDYTSQQIAAGIQAWSESDMHHPSAIPSFVHRIVNRPDAGKARQSRSDTDFAQAESLKRFDAEQGAIE